jgi:hypothetical protein
MLGVIAKVLLFFALVIVGIAVALNATDKATWGTLAFSPPDPEPCFRYSETLKSRPVLTEVRWIWTTNGYGWGCHLEFGDASSGTVTPMPDSAGHRIFRAK